MKCEFCRHAGVPEVGSGDRECRRYPPVPVMVLTPDKITRQMVPHVIAFWPKVNREQSCGEWASKIAVA
jgi:hypothetical protein